MSPQFISIASLIVSILTLGVAFTALQSWKKQFNKSLQRDFVVSALDAIHQISQINLKILNIFNNETEQNKSFLLNSTNYLNPIVANHYELIEKYNESIAELFKSLNRLNKLLNNKYLLELSEEYIECLSDIAIFFQSETLIGFKHPNIQEISKKGWTTSWLDKACDKELMLEMAIEDELIKLLKI